MLELLSASSNSPDHTRSSKKSGKVDQTGKYLISLGPKIAAPLLFSQGTYSDCEPAAVHITFCCHRLRLPLSMLPSRSPPFFIRTAPTTHPPLVLTFTTPVSHSPPCSYPLPATIQPCPFLSCALIGQPAHLSVSSAEFGTYTSRVLAHSTTRYRPGSNKRPLFSPVRLALRRIPYALVTR
eukprot:590609-Hanusia_phi.AAC.1